MTRNIEIPSGKTFNFKENGEDVFSKPFELLDPITISINSRFEPLFNNNRGIAGLLGGESTLNILGIKFPLNFATNFGGLQNMGYQVWKQTDPLHLSITTELSMEYSGKEDVLEPIKKLMSYTLPSIGSDDVLLIPPGPGLQEFITQSIPENLLAGINARLEELDVTATQYKKVIGEPNPVLSIRIGDYILLQNILITSVVPTFENTYDDKGFPVKATVSMDIVTQATPTTKMLEAWGM